MTEMADAFRRGEVRAEALVGACLDRIERHNGKVNAVIRLDRAAALEEAAAADKARSAAGGAEPGPLAGVPMMHKDMYYREGRVSTCGSRIRRDFVPEATATVLRRLDAAGAIDLGTLNMAEFAQNPTGHNAHFGHCHNPWRHDYCPGGSSSGSGAGVAARFFRGARLRYRRLDPPAGVHLRRDRAEADADPHVPFRRDAALLFRRQCRPLVRMARDAARSPT